MAMSGKHNGKAAVATAASIGIGARIARHWTAKGATVVENYASGEGAVRTLVASIRGAGGGVVAAQTDVANANELKQMCAEAVTVFGRLDALVKNAGVYRFGPNEYVTDVEFHRLRPRYPRPYPGRPGGAQTLRARGRQHHQRQLSFGFEPVAADGSLLVQEGRHRQLDP
jgi:NAD(P)-dependent dehydrogenase (short-subunit alcohol dehydrogenase family)